MTDAPDWITLTEGEQVVWSGRPSITPYLLAAAGSILLIVVGIAIAVVAPSTVMGFNVPEVVPWRIGGGVVALVGVLGLFGELLGWWARGYVVTTEEVYEKHGLVSRTVTNLQHDRVQNTTFTQGITGRLFSYGDVFVETAGGQGPEVVFKNVDDPNDVVGKITKHLDESAAA